MILYYVLPERIVLRCLKKINYRMIAYLSILINPHIPCTVATKPMISGSNINFCTEIVMIIIPRIIKNMLIVFFVILPD
tara:strand:- start:272 stop:508 length:237 start_codon:yes stop_codon:yes gene_type:complete